MKINFFYFFFLFLLTTKIVGQTTSDTVFVYDTIIVYETKTVYDTIKVFDEKHLDSEFPEKNFKKNNTLQNAVLAIDTATLKAELILFNKKDTATISINSIIVTENLNNSDTMKKKILTLAATALLTQTNFAQGSQTKAAATDSNKVKKSAYSIETIVFQNKKNPNKTYEITLPTTQRISFISRKAISTLNFDNASNPNGRYLFRGGIITHMNDSLITIKYQRFINMKISREYAKELRKIRKDKTLSDEEKENKYFHLTYTDSVIVPLKLLKSIRFSRFNNKNKKFYNTNWGHGFNEQIKPTFIWGIYTESALIGEILFLAPVSLAALPVALSLYGVTAIGGIILTDATITKKINLKRWELKTK